MTDTDDTLIDRKAYNSFSSLTDYTMYRTADTWSRAASQAGFASRAAFKLTALDEKFKILKPGQIVLDLGAAPGAFSQVALKAIKPGGKLIAVDQQAIDKSVFEKYQNMFQFYRADIFQWQVPAPFVGHVDVLLSDLMSATTGITEIDHANSINLCMRALQIGNQSIKKGGCMVSKVFQGEQHVRLINQFKLSFNKVQTFKPQASRSNSKETFIVAMNKR